MEVGNIEFNQNFFYKGVKGGDVPAGLPTVTIPT